ncbi:hypothetical protein Tco_1283888 [Tanacetum coccineum]
MIGYNSQIIKVNKGSHTSCLILLLHRGEFKLASLFEVKQKSESNGEESEGFSVNLDIKPLTKLPWYASHLRAAFVKIPECGTIGSLVESSSIGLRSICINWNCKSTICIAYSQKKQDTSLYFKVVAAEPTDEPVLRINRTQTALVLAASAPSALPPESFTS